MSLTKPEDIFIELSIKYMKNTYGVLALSLALAVFAGAHSVEAAPAKSGNPNTVANYETGDHGIPGDYYLHTGADIVTRLGNSGNFDQWFMGWAAETGGNIGHHSVWKVSKDGTCKSDEVLVPNASSNWGDYLVAGADYCVKTNDFAY
jgi:hypothetical protein